MTTDNPYQREIDDRLESHDQWVKKMMTLSQQTEGDLQPVRLEYMLVCARDAILRLIILPAAELARQDVEAGRISGFDLRRSAIGETVPVPSGLESVLDGKYVDIGAYRFVLTIDHFNRGLLKITDMSFLN